MAPSTGMSPPSQSGKPHKSASVSARGRLGSSVVALGSGADDHRIRLGLRGRFRPWVRHQRGQQRGGAVHAAITSTASRSCGTARAETKAVASN